MDKIYEINYDNLKNQRSQFGELNLDLNELDEFYIDNLRDKLIYLTDKRLHSILSNFINLDESINISKFISMK